MKRDVTMRNNNSVRISRLSYLYFITMCLSLPLFSQITIKEKVVITPKQNARTVFSGTHTIRHVFKFSGSLDPGHLPSNFFGVDDNCGRSQSYFSIGSDGVTDTREAKSGLYLSTWHLFFNQGQNAETTSVYLDDILLLRYAFSHYCPQSCHEYRNDLSASLFKGFNFTTSPPSISHGSSKSFGISGSGSDCGTTVWHGSLPMTWTITQGADLGSFYKGGVSIGETATGNTSYLDSVSFVANGRQPCNSGGDPVVITATSNGIIDSVNFWVTPTLSLHHFAVTILPETVSTCQPGTITAVAKDANDSTAFLACTTLLKLTATNGRFIRGSDTLASPLDSIPYGEVRSGTIGVIPQTFSYSSATEQVIVTVKKSNDTTKTGRDTVVFAIPVTLDLTVNSTIIQPRQTTGKDTTGVTVTAMRCGTPVPDILIRFQTDFVPQSGGHDHNNPTLARSNQGVFRIDTLSLGNPTTDIQTDENGEVAVQYKASEIAGDYIVTAFLSSDGNIKDTVSLTLKVPNLQELQAGENYVLVGAPGDPDFCYPTVTSLHNHNHYGTAKLIQAIQRIANKYNSVCQTSILRINDMSLIYGGGFDIGNHWKSDIIDQYPTDPTQCNDIGHCGHRIGRNADIGHRGIYQTSTCVELDIITLREIILGATKNSSWPEGNHEHIRVN